MARTKGGLGFHSLHGYNFSMKHVWSFINKLDTLVARVFRARYYPDNHVDTTTRNGGSNFIWSGIWAAKEVLKKGFRWVLGNGEKVNVCTYPWLRGKHNFMIENKEYWFDSNIKVCNFFKPGLFEWDEKKTRSSFKDDDIKAILETDISQHIASDKIAWTHTKDGRCSMKLGIMFGKIII